MPLEILRSTVSTLVIPTILLAAFACQGYGSTAHWASWLLGMGAYVAYIYMAGDWFLVGRYARVVLLAGYAIAAVISSIGVRSLPFIPPFDLKHSVGILFLVLFAPLVILAFRGRHSPGTAVEGAFPLSDGIYYVAEGGSNAVLNHHYPARYARFALDIVKVNKLGFRACGFYPRDLTKYRIFGDTVSSPVDGTIAAAVDGHPDMVPPRQDAEHPPGNYLMIKDRSSGALVLLAHLQRGSLLVQEGQSVSARQAIARVGNSGISTEPHLHVSCEVDENEEYNLDGVGLPLLLEGKFLSRNSLIRIRRA